ncbi:methyltransferase domain-containing protein [Nocardioides sp.]|uniref:class I SAM-dependent methyltransferase n=1 Tax=Nocardioides sp. TaxID=35761 RepID=UPI003785243D
MTRLPDFSDHDTHAKVRPLKGPESFGVVHRDWLERVTEARPRSQLRVLDVGCGSGGHVAWMLEQGWDAYGLEVEPRYVEHGEAYLEPRGWGARLGLVGESGEYPYPDEYFDAIVSDQVLEHVEDLGALAREVARVTKPGGRGLHVFPARWTPREPHMHTPIVHWLPKGALRRAGIRLALRTGQAAPYFANEHTLEERTEIFDRYSTERTFYRSPRSIAATLSEAGLIADVNTPLRRRAEANPLVPSMLAGPAAYAYRTFRGMLVETFRP